MSAGVKNKHTTKPVITDSMIDIMSADYRTADKAARSLHPTVKAHGTLVHHSSVSSNSVVEKRDCSHNRVAARIIIIIIDQAFRS